jgi:hypothetical protein
LFGSNEFCVAFDSSDNFLTEQLSKQKKVSTAPQKKLILDIDETP